MKDNKYYEDLEKEGYYKTIDKRSKDYREYKEYLKSKEDFKALQKNVEENTNVGLGDVVEKIAKVTGINKVVDALVDDCGCDDRKEKFNKIPLWKRRKVNCIEESDYPFVKEFIKMTRYSYEDRERFIPIYNFVFRVKVKNTNCDSCFRGYIKNMKKYLEIYEN